MAVGKAQIHDTRVAYESDDLWICEHDLKLRTPECSIKYESW